MFAARLARSTARPAARAAQKRTFSAPAGEVQYEGAEAVVRQYLPKDEHVVAGMIGFYAGLYLLSKVVFGGGAEEETVTASAVSSGNSDLLSAEDEGFDAWIEIPGNAERWEASFE